MFDVSVVVPTHNRLSHLPDLLASLSVQDYPSDRWELLVVVDGSTDGTLEYLQSAIARRPANMRVISQEQSGVAATRNKGARQAHGKAVIFLDDDMIASTSLVREHALVHLKDPGAVVIGHVSVPADEPAPWVYWENSQMGRHFDALRNGARTPGPRDVYTGNCSVSADLFQRIGGFNTSLPRTEDVELGYRLADAGANFHYRSDADSLHLGRHTYSSWLRNARLYGRCDVLLAWEQGHTHLQPELFRWYHGRNVLNRALVRACSSMPALEPAAIASLHLVGRLSHKSRVYSLSTACYSALYNLAYWLAMAETLGKEQFWKGVRSDGQAMLTQDGGTVIDHRASTAIIES